MGASKTYSKVRTKCRILGKSTVFSPSQDNMKLVVDNGIRRTYVTTAFGFFSTAYTRILMSAFLAAFMEAVTRGPLPAPNTITTLQMSGIVH